MGITQSLQQGLYETTYSWKETLPSTKQEKNAWEFWLLTEKES